MHSSLLVDTSSIMRPGFNHIGLSPSAAPRRNSAFHRPVASRIWRPFQEAKKRTLSMANPARRKTRWDIRSKRRVGCRFAPNPTSADPLVRTPHPTGDASLAAGSASSQPVCEGCRPAPRGLPAGRSPQRRLRPMPYRAIRIARFGGPEVLELAVLPGPPEPGAGEVLIKVQGAGTGFTDTFIRRGRYPDVKGPLPITLGYEVVGTVEAAGPGVAAPVVGQMVADLCVTGGYAQYALRPAAGVVVVPDGIDPAEAVCIPLAYLTAHQMPARPRVLPTGARPRRRRRRHGRHRAARSGARDGGRRGACARRCRGSAARPCCCRAPLRTRSGRTKVADAWTPPRVFSPAGGRPCGSHRRGCRRARCPHGCARRVARRRSRRRWRVPSVRSAARRPRRRRTGVRRARPR